VALKTESLKKLRKIKNKWKVDSWEEFDKRESDLYKKFFQNKEPTILGKIKISAGSKKNFLLDIPANTRPLTNRLKVTLFDLLSTDILKKRVLDLFAGSGAFGFEALSRGAKECTFVDAAKASEKVLIQNSRKTGFLTETVIVRQKVDEFLYEQLKKEETGYDLIFIDPPYKIYNTKDMSKITFILTSAKDLLTGFVSKKKTDFPGALIVKHPRRYPIDKIPLENLRKIVTYDFGLNSVSFYIIDK